MIKIIKADVYRIFRSKGFYITIALLLTLIGILVTTGQLYISYEDTQTQYILPGMSAPFEMMAASDLMAYFILAFVIFICSADFSENTVKNVISNGVSRTKYYISKLILSCIFCFLVFFLYITVSTVSATVIYGFGGTFNISFIGEALRPFFAQLFMLTGLTCIGVFLAFTTKKTAAVIGIYFALLFVPVLLIGVNDKFLQFNDYTIIANTLNFLNIDSMVSYDIIKSFAVGALYILLSTVGGVLLFKRCEIK